MTTDIAGAMAELVDSLKAAGIAATADVSKVEYPGIIVMPGTLEFPYLDGTQFDMQFNLWIVAADKGSVETWIELQNVLQKLRTVYEIADAIPINRPISSTSNPVPALLVTLKTTIS